jgi:uncharacterized protein with GYD domain
MATSLAQFTDQGIRTVKDTTKRTAALKEAAKRFGVEVKHMYWTLGQYDAVVIEGADEAAATAFALSVASAGNVRLQTLRAFSADELNAIVEKLG